nr:MAG TPA: hypothetical protein [Caudoviricetes sp.]
MFYPSQIYPLTNSTIQECKEHHILAISIDKYPDSNYLHALLYIFYILVIYHH